VIRSSFDNFFESGQHWNIPQAGKVENRVRMTPFCTRNIPTMFGVYFLSFPVSTIEKCFIRILTNISSSEHHQNRPGVSKVKN